MAKEPQFILNGNSFSALLAKLDRDKVYGWTETKYSDSAGNACQFITMLDDGRTMLGSGGVALKSIDAKGDEVEKASLVARNLDGSEANLYPSIFDVETKLDTSKTISDYLDMDVKVVYQLTINENKESLLKTLAETKVLYFQFNYRAGYDTDDAFLIAQGEHIFAVVGKVTNFQYSTLALPTVLEDEEEETSDDLDFNMF